MTPLLELSSVSKQFGLNLVLDRVSRDNGQVKLDGEVWTARPFADDEVYEPGDEVTVMHIDGATAVVWKNP